MQESLVELGLPRPSSTPPDDSPRGRPAAPISDDGEVDMGDPLVCSAKGCQLPAAWALLWNNPKLHTPERRKTWLACDEHRTTLGDFLGARKFLKDVVPVADRPADEG